MPLLFLWRFSANQGLTMTATALAAVGSNANESGTLIISGTAQTASGTNVDFANVIPSWAKRITVMFNGVSVAANTATGYVQLGTGSTPTYVTSGYVNVGSQIGASTVSSGNNTVGFAVFNQGTAASIMQGLITLTNLTGNTWTAFGGLSEAGSGRQFISSGSVTLGAALTSIRVNHADTFDAGTINIFWE
jgi:hypothetical protein